jgi:hypothetical protein
VVEASITWNYTTWLNLAFPETTFDTVATACTFCSVPKPVLGLREL